MTRGRALEAQGRSTAGLRRPHLGPRTRRTGRQTLESPVGSARPRLEAVTVAPVQPSPRQPRSGRRATTGFASAVTLSTESTPVPRRGTDRCQAPRREAARPDRTTEVEANRSHGRLAEARGAPDTAPMTSEAKPDIGRHQAWHPARRRSRGRGRAYSPISSTSHSGDCADFSAAPRVLHWGVRTTSGRPDLPAARRCRTRAVR